MKRIKLFITVLVVLVGVIFQSNGIITSASTKMHKTATVITMSKTKIKALQTSLKRLGYFKYKVDGVFGTNTKNAVKGFQRVNRLPVDGVAGSRTLAKINQKLNSRKGTSKFITSRGLSGNAAKVIDFAKRYLGVDYSFGSASPDEFDCSGFTMYVFRVAGISLPHSAAAQANVGLAVSRNNLEPGDLVFFHTYKAGISHVGIYLGNGYFIHASSGAGHVTITSLSEDYYSERFRGGARVLND